MMNTARDFEDVRISLYNGIDQEILRLKHFMESLEDDIFLDDSKTVARICQEIFRTSEGLKKLADVLGFIDCWEENGEPPQLSQNNDMIATWDEKTQPELKEWQKEVMFREGTLS